MKCLNLLTVIVSLLLAQHAFSKDMTHRLGVGFKNNTSVSVPSLSAVYFADKDTAYTASAGIDTLKNYTAFQGSVGLRYVVFFENNLNCYVGGQAGVINVETPATGKQSGAEFLAVGGVEFFFSGLENLGLTAEAGVGLATIGSTRIYTTALDPVKAGFTFYF
jgi:hypothetical protein